MASIVAFLKRYWAYPIVFAIGMVSVAAPSGSPLTPPALVALLIGVLGLFLWGRRVTYAYSDALVEAQPRLTERVKPNIMLVYLHMPTLFIAISDSKVRTDSRLEALSRRYTGHLVARWILLVSLVLAAALRSAF